MKVSYLWVNWNHWGELLSARFFFFFFTVLGRKGGRNFKLSENVWYVIGNVQAKFKVRGLIATSGKINTNLSSQNSYTHVLWSALIV